MRRLVHISVRNSLTHCALPLRLPPQRDSKAAKKKRDERRGETRAHNAAKADKSEAKRDKKSANKKDEDDLDALLAGRSARPHAPLNGWPRKMAFVIKLVSS